MNQQGELTLGANKECSKDQNRRVTSCLHPLMLGFKLSTTITQLEIGSILQLQRVTQSLFVAV